MSISPPESRKILSVNCFATTSQMFLICYTLGRLVLKNRANLYLMDMVRAVIKCVEEMLRQPERQAINSR